MELYEVTFTKTYTITEDEVLRNKEENNKLKNIEIAEIIAKDWFDEDIDILCSEDFTKETIIITGTPDDH